MRSIDSYMVGSDSFCRPLSKAEFYELDLGDVWESDTPGWLKRASAMGIAAAQSDKATWLLSWVDRAPLDSCHDAARALCCVE